METSYFKLNGEKKINKIKRLFGIEQKLCDVGFQKT